MFVGTTGKFRVKGGYLVFFDVPEDKIDGVDSEVIAVAPGLPIDEAASYVASHLKNKFGLEFDVEEYAIDGDRAFKLTFVGVERPSRGRWGKSFAEEKKEAAEVVQPDVQNQPSGE